MSIFHAYDIRGVFPDEINDTTITEITQALVKYLQQKNGQQELTLVLGRDGRASSPELAQAVSTELIRLGVKILDVGTLSTPHYYFAVKYLQADGGLQITASHNPPQYNGLKITAREAVPLGLDNGLGEIQRTMGEVLPSAETPGTIEIVDTMNDYIASSEEVLPLEPDATKLKVIADAGSGVAGLSFHDYCQTNKITCQEINFTPDGAFPHRGPDPISDPLTELTTRVVNESADIGVAFDADGDRLVLIDEKGQKLPGDVTAGLVAVSLLKKNKDAQIILDVRAGRDAKRAITEAGGRLVTSRVGHTFIKSLMRADGAIFAGEISGHFYFSQVGFFEAPLVVVSAILNLLAESGKKLSELASPLQIMARSGEVNFTVADKAKALQTLKETFGDATAESELDGITIDYDDWWFNVRPSNTENLLRVNLEASTSAQRDEELAKITKILSNL